MKVEFLIVYFVIAVVLAGLMELADIAFKKLKTKIKAKKLEKAQQPIKEDE